MALRPDRLDWGAIRKGKWKLVSKHPNSWELYDIEADRTELNELSADRPDIVAELTELYNAWAKRCNVLPEEELQALREKKPENKSR